MASTPSRSPGDDFAPAWRSFDAWARKRLEQAIRRSAEVGGRLGFSSESILSAFLDELHCRLQRIAIRTFTARLRERRHSGLLRGDTPQQRFANFVHTELARADGRQPLFTSYPVLHRLLSQATRREVNARSELVARLEADWNSLCALFGWPPSDSLTGLESGFGERHGGRHVLMLQFRSGLRLVYKPRPVAVDSHFQALLDWFNARGLEPRLRLLRVLDRGEYGWCEYVPPRPCRDLRQVEAFYRRIGAILFLTYLLDGVDLHAENLVACGEHPILVDLETLFQSRPQARSKKAREASVLDDLASELVIRTGLLPQQMWGEKGSVEISGLAGGGRQLAPHRVARWRCRGADTMHRVMTRVSMPRTYNRPRLRGTALGIAEYRQNLIDGFIQAYGLAVKHRQELLAPCGPILAFRGDWVRFLARGSQTYATLLEESYRPSCMKDARERDQLFTALREHIDDQPYLLLLVASETDDLWTGDVPAFRARVGSRDLYDLRGKRVRGFFESSALDRVLRRVNSLGNPDLERQIDCIERSFACLTEP
jgi:type 2 lantibiotic biosynthesis protein LanM